MPTETEVNKLPYIIAIDFDGTLVTDKFPEIGEPTALMEFAKIWMKSDAKLILWTCRDNERLEAAVRFCASHGLAFDAINENIPEVQDKYRGDTRKVYADVYVDDKAVLPEVLNPMLKVITLVQQLKEKEPCL